ncbi:MAG TPA: hypothetical protein VFF68_07595, partial [Anaerolineaceae bacterium]|nr:hypothetical protein [Anaerolineaceae bacterium]
TGNQGYAILREPGDAPGTVDAVANNLFGNRSGVQVECNGHGTVNHNFWGSGVNVTAAVSNCPVDAGKRLGAAILQSSAGPGVEAVQATVTAQKQYAFSNSIGFFRTGNGADFPLFIVNHGRGAVENVPFTNPGDLIPCSNYWDVFLPTGVNPPGMLDLFFDYASDASCVAAIELSTEYCKNSDAARYPLWWHDPATGATSGWDTTSSTGQTTTCRTDDDELQVSIDASGRPNLANDLKFAPFVVAIHSAALTDFKAEPGNKQVKVTWRAASEVNTRGYFLHRSTQADSGYQVVSDFFPAKGGDMVAANYEHLDQSLTNDTTYYYRLEIVGENLVSTFTAPISAVPAVPTATPTPTRTNTPTITPTRTVTPTRTATITRTPWVYRTSTLAATRTPYRFPTIAGYRSPTPRVTRTPTPRFGVTQSPSPRVTTRSTAGSGYPAAGTPSLEATSAGSYPQPGATGQSSAYPGPAGATLPPDATDPTGAAGAAGTAAASLTPTRVGTAVAAPTQPDEPGGPLAFAGLLAGAVLGLLVLGAGGWYLWSRSMLPPFFAFLPPPPAGGAGSGSANPPGSLE